MVKHLTLLLIIGLLSGQEGGHSQQSKVDSSRFSMSDNELQGLRKMLLQAMLKDSIDAQKQAQAKIEAEIASRESEKAKRDSLIEEKISALEAVQSELDSIEHVGSVKLKNQLNEIKAKISKVELYSIWVGIIILALNISFGFLLMIGGIKYQIYEIKISGSIWIIMIIISLGAAILIHNIFSNSLNNMVNMINFMTFK